MAWNRNVGAAQNVGIHARDTPAHLNFSIIEHLRRIKLHQIDRDQFPAHHGERVPTSLGDQLKSNSRLTKTIYKSAVHSTTINPEPVQMPNQTKVCSLMMKCQFTKIYPCSTVGPNIPPVQPDWSKATEHIQYHSPHRHPVNITTRWAIMAVALYPHQTHGQAKVRHCSQTFSSPNYNTQNRRLAIQQTAILPLLPPTWTKTSHAMATPQKIKTIIVLRTWQTMN